MLLSQQRFLGTTANVFLRYKLHVVCSVSVIFHSLDLSPSATHNIIFLKDIEEQLSNCFMLGDKGYLSSEAQLDLFNYAKIILGNL